MSEIGTQILGDGEAGNEQGSIISIYEIVLNDIKDAFALISTDNGYRNNIASINNSLRSSYKTVEYPEIGVYLGQRRVGIEDASWKVSNIECDVFVHGTVKETDVMDIDSSALNDKMESLAHDFLKVIYKMSTKQINTFMRGRWVLDPNSSVKIGMSTAYGNKDTMGYVIMEFKVILLAVGEMFV